MAWLRVGGARTDSDASWLWAAFVPLAVRLAWSGPSPTVPGLADCGNLLSPLAIERALEALVVVGSLAAVGLVLGADRASLSLRWPSRAIVGLSVAIPVVLIPIGLGVGPALGEPFFGPLRIEFGIASAIIPALVLALGNSALEELIFRGAILGWGARAIGPTGALGLQAILFGLVHVGPDYTSPVAAVPVLIAVVAGGLVAGLIVQRTGSLLLPFAIHVALDVPLYYAVACRLPG